MIPGLSHLAQDIGLKTDCGALTLHDAILRTVLMRSKNSFSWVKQGSIIVMHTNRQSTVEALPKIIASLKKGI